MAKVSIIPSININTFTGKEGRKERVGRNSKPSQSSPANIIHCVISGNHLCPSNYSARMPLSPEEQTRLDELNGKITALKEKISTYEALLTPAEILTRENFFNPLNTQLAELRIEKNRLEAKATSIPQGKLFHSLISSIAFTDAFLSFLILVITNCELI